MPITASEYMEPKFCVIRIIAEEPSKNHIQATGFFYFAKPNIYFVTCKHVLCDTGWQPTRLKIFAPAPGGQVSDEGKTIELYSDKKQNWLVHNNPQIDLALIPLDEKEWNGFEIHAFSAENKLSIGGIMLGTDVLVIGYPQGIYDSRNNTPIAKAGTIASEYDLGFEGLPRFVIDGRMHTGMSGSPVIVKGLFMASTIGTEHDRHIQLIGIHAGPLPVRQRLQYDDWITIYKPLDLNEIWRASLIEEILSQ